MTTILSNETVLYYVEAGEVKNTSPAELAKQVNELTIENLAGLINNTWMIERRDFFAPFNYIGDKIYFVDRGERAVAGILEDLIAEGYELESKAI